MNKPPRNHVHMHPFKVIDFAWIVEVFSESGNIQRVVGAQTLPGVDHQT